MLRCTAGVAWVCSYRRSAGVAVALARSGRRPALLSRSYLIAASLITYRVAAGVLIAAGVVWWA
jgi:hypothetical protein